MPQKRKKNNHSNNTTPENHEEAFTNPMDPRRKKQVKSYETYLKNLLPTEKIPDDFIGTVYLVLAMCYTCFGILSSSKVFVWLGIFFSCFAVSRSTTDLHNKKSFLSLFGSSISCLIYLYYHSPLPLSETSEVLAFMSMFQRN